MICERCHQDHERVVAACKANLYRFSRICCGYNIGPEHAREPSADFHGRVCQWYQKQLDANERFIFVAVPRKHLKSSILTVANCLWILVRDPNERILLVSETSDLAEDWVGQMKALIQRDSKDFFGFAHYFPELVPDPKKTIWNAGEFCINRPGTYSFPSVKAVGLRATVTGMACTMVILDDLVGKVVASSPELLDNAKSMLRETRRTFADPNTGRQLVVGTLWPGGYYEDLCKDKNFAKLILGCYRDGRWEAQFGGEATGEPVWKEGFTQHTLTQQRELDGEFEFAHQWLNTFVEEGLRRFNEDDLRYFVMDGGHERVAFGVENSESVPIGNLIVRMIVDPSTGEGKDETAIVICGWHRERCRLFVLEAWSARALPPAIIDKIFELNAKWRPRALSIEEVAFQKTFKHWLAAEMTRRDDRLPIRTDVKPESRKKSARIIDGFQPFVAAHQVYFHRTQAKLIRQLLDYDPAREDQADDLVDCLAYHAQFCTYSPREYKDPNEIPLAKTEDGAESGRWYGLECVA